MPARPAALMLSASTVHRALLRGRLHLAGALSHPSASTSLVVQMTCATFYVNLTVRRGSRNMIHICGRRVKVQTGTKSQTVNICSSANIHGQYDYIVRLRPPFISTETLLTQNFSSIQDLVSYLERHHFGDIERTPAIGSSGVTQILSNIAPPAPNSAHPLVELFRSAEVNSFASMRLAATALSEEELLLRFEQQRKAAPRRGEHGSYFGRHTGKTTSGRPTNRREEHLAIALWRAYRESGFALPDGKILFPVEYQLPLKSHRDEANGQIGKVDLFCVESEGEPWIIEIKVHSARNGSADTPLKALLEALAYCAILDADMRCLSRESDDKKLALLHVVSPIRPNLLILAPSEYWNSCDLAESRHRWRESLQALGQRIEVALKVKVRFVRMEDCRWEMTTSGMPRLIESPVFDWAIPNG